MEIWQRYSKPMQLSFLDFEAAFDFPHRGRLLNASRPDRVPGKFVRLPDDMNQRTTAAVQTPAKNSRSVPCRYHTNTIRTSLDRSRVR
ncbi:hypothetical protein RB195_015228 [Necator americanus]|uniref:Uncharacterized protein n=1 Tax=Necator americanus TaxID=51031 RepID=A0ABR1E4T4_NECAM